jgi:hypothetical protein
MAGLQVTDVLAVGVMRLIEGPVPDNSQPQRRWRIRRRRRPEQPELQVITQITGISILHTPTMAHTSGKITGASSAIASVTASARGTLTGRAATDAATRASRSAVTAATLACSRLEK